MTTRNNVRARLLDYADALGVRVIYADLTALDRDGEYDHRTRTIRLQHGMAPRLWASVMAHELAHAVFEDVPSKFGPVNAKQERRADEWAALRLISFCAYKEAELHYGGNTRGIAVALGVIEDIVLAFQRILLRLGDTVYVKPRMGAGQWDVRIDLEEAGVA
ncbi:ImmA/IrrE family metallo-endopeptidase [Microbacterium oryzae]|uniref:ImmA/IrrE family metallo-endopeptidase n=1 Tax=Microbacterium oryzae TaxID=743009 RepID=UPI0025AF479C|nr:ImmA/IrrE family metallo-endopeptidase [Microbacterium oryzae]MDN3310642.1 ImmA/IrrE family metallo-endopeptidase [Microbacterium oryzae]